MEKWCHGNEEWKDKTKIICFNELVASLTYLQFNSTRPGTAPHIVNGYKKIQTVEQCSNSKRGRREEGRGEGRQTTPQ